MLNTFKNIFSFQAKKKSTISTNENDKLILKEYPLFDFSTFSNHTMIDVIISPASEHNNTIKLYIPEKIFELLELKMEKDFKIQFKPHEYQILINNGENPRIEIPSHNLTSISNHSIGSLQVKKGVDIEKHIRNSGSGDVSIDNFLGQVLENASMGDVNIQNIHTKNLKLTCKGSGNVNIQNGHIENLESHTKSMGNVDVDASITSAKIYSTGSGDTNVSHISNDIDIQLKSMGNVVVDSSSIDQLVVSSSGSGKVTVKNLNTKSAKFQSSSMGKMAIHGTSIESDINSTGSGEFKGNFRSTNTVVNMSSMGDVNIEVTKQLKASIQGSGSLNLLGQHVLDNLEAHITSMGSITSTTVQSHCISVTGKPKQCNIKTPQDNINTSNHSKRFKP